MSVLVLDPFVVSSVVAGAPVTLVDVTTNTAAQPAPVPNAVYLDLTPDGTPYVIPHRQMPSGYRITLGTDGYYYADLTGTTDVAAFGDVFYYVEA